jgi:hypothetical protein
MIVRKARPGAPPPGSAETADQAAPLDALLADSSGRIGAVLLSPLIRPGTVSTVRYNHYSLLRTIEDIFGLPHLGDAAMPQVRSFGANIFGQEPVARLQRASGFWHCPGAGIET